MWSVKKIWFQLHWLVGITAGSMLVVIGLTGAVFSFHEEILDWLNPGIASVTARGQTPPPALSAPQLLQAVRDSGNTQRIDRLAMYAQSGRNPQVTFAPAPSQRRGETVYLNA